VLLLLTLQMRAFVLKFPMAFSYQPQNVRNWIERFQQLCLTRDEWTREYQLAMTPSLMAFFLRDASDLLLRFEYLASTGGYCQYSSTAVQGLAGQYCTFNVLYLQCRAVECKYNGPGCHAYSPPPCSDWSCEPIQKSSRNLDKLDTAASILYHSIYSISTWKLKCHDNAAANVWRNLDLWLGFVGC
jgi:hypothetical protein